MFFQDTHSSGRAEHDVHFVLFNQFPPDAAVWTDGQSLIYDGGHARHQRPVNDVTVPHHPANIAGRKIGFPCLCIENMLHAGSQRNCIPPGITLNTLGLSCGARGVQGIAGVGAVDPHAIYFCIYVGLSQPLVVVIALGMGAVGNQTSIYHQHGIRLMMAQGDSLIQQGLVGHQFPASRARIGTDDQTRCGVIYAGGQRMRCKAAKHN